MALELLNSNRRLTEDLLRTGSCDCSYSLGHKARFRVNIFTQRGHYTIILRQLSTEIPSLAQMNMPAVFRQIARGEDGAGAGDRRDRIGQIHDAGGPAQRTQRNEVDPRRDVGGSCRIRSSPEERRRSTSARWETDFASFAAGLRAALRQAPKVILVGEMRDRETVEIGMSAAETGHLVMTTLHTIDAGQTINRIIGMFDQSEEKQIRIRLAETIRWIVSQRLLPKIGGGRVAALEIMGNSLRVKDSIEHGEIGGQDIL